MACVASITLKKKARGPPSVPLTCNYVPPFAEVKNSAIHGKGVFATRTLRPPLVLAKYAGEVLTAAQLNERYPPPLHPAYVLQVGSRFIDSSRCGGNWTRFINDSHGTTLKNNCRFNKAGNIELTRKVEEGEELLVSYGAGFWASMRAEEESKGVRRRKVRRVSQEEVDRKRKQQEAARDRTARLRARTKRKRDFEARQLATRSSQRQRTRGPQRSHASV